MLIILLPFALLAQPLPDAPAKPSPISSLDELPIEQATAPRCGLVFALVSRWQKSGDERGSAWPDMESEGGREFFVRAMADLMDTTGMNRDQVSALIYAEMAELGTPEGEGRIKAMMPACMALKQSAGL